MCGWLRLRCWRKSRNIAQNFVHGAHDILDADLGFYKVSVSPELFTTGSLVF